MTKKYDKQLLQEYYDKNQMAIEKHHRDIKVLIKEQRDLENKINRD